MSLPIAAPVPLTAAHDAAGFECGEPILDEWLRRRALASEGRHARTYVACAGDAIAGFHALAAGAVERGGVPGRLRRNAPEAIPVVVIARLAVDRRHAGRGLGADLLLDALRRIAGAAETIGVGAVLVQAKSDRARDWYLRLAEFAEFPAGSRTLFLPIATLREIAVQR
jgi:hypothetical protein